MTATEELMQEAEKPEPARSKKPPLRTVPPADTGTPRRETRDRVSDPEPTEPMPDAPADSNAAREAPPPADQHDADSGEMPNSSEVNDDTESAPNAPTTWRGDKDSPFRFACDYVSRYANHPDGPTLHRWREDYYRWSDDAGYHVRQSKEQVEADLVRRKHISRSTLKRDVYGMLHAVEGVLIDHAEIGSWIGEPTVNLPALELAPVRNGLLHLRTKKIYRSTPRYFNTAALATRFDAKAAWPKLWIKFLEEIYPDDDKSIQLLQEWFGYLLTADTRQQKILLLIGKKRSGKGTIARVLTALLGQDSVCGPPLASFGTNFGLWVAIGKLAAIIGDARLGGRSDIAAVVEKLLTISGEDALTIDRKHREPWTGYLKTRIMIVSNELPRFTDASDALPGRMLVSKLEQSFYGKENHNLTNELLSELPGILLWAIEGWQRLDRRGHFEQPSKWAHLIDKLEDVASPVRAWIRERCMLAGDIKDDPKDPKMGAKERRLCIAHCDLAYADFKAWCEGQEQKTFPTKTRFGIDLGTIGDIAISRATGDQVWILRNSLDQHFAQERPWIYSGMRLKTKEELDPKQD